LLAQPDQIEHVNWAGAIVGLELSEDFLGRIDMAHAALLLAVARSLSQLAAPPNRQLSFR
jgi:hypothetical protein